MSDAPLTLAYTLALAEIVRAAQTTAKVARANHNGSVAYGTARSIGQDADHGFLFLGKDEDIRDAYLRVTTREGFEVAWPVVALMSEAEFGLFCLYDW